MVSRRHFLGATTFALTGLFLDGCSVRGKEKTDWKWKEGHFQSHFIYTGGGESLFFIYPDGTSLLIDCGDAEPDAGKPWPYPICPEGVGRSAARVAAYVKAVNPNGNKVDYLMLTHYHADHGGRKLKSTNLSADGLYYRCGLGEIVDLLEFDTAIDRSYPDFNDPIPVDMAWDDGMADNCRGVYQSLEKRGKKVEKFLLDKNSSQLYPRHGKSESFSVRPIAANGRVLMPDGTIRGLYGDYLKKTKPKEVNENALSIAVLFKYGKFSLYTGGDIEGTYKDESGNSVNMEEEVALSTGRVNVAKINHHGIECPRLFAERLRPQVWVGTQWSKFHMVDKVIKTITDEKIHSAALLQYRPLMNEPCHIVADVDPGGTSYDACAVSGVNGKVLINKHFEL